MTHADLVARAVRWLRNQKACKVVFAEYSGPTMEQPDAIGFHRGSFSVLVECKTSRPDFHADRRKPFRSHPSYGMGRERWYLTPAGLLTTEDLPEGWGLVEVANARSLRIVRPSSVFNDRAWHHEMAILSSAVRRHELGVEWRDGEARFAPHGTGVDAPGGTS
jgi:hypothetical protein